MKKGRGMKLIVPVVAVADVDETVPFPLVVVVATVSQVLLTEL